MTDPPMTWDEKTAAAERVICVGCRRAYDVYQPQVPYVCAFCTPTVSQRGRG